MRKHTDRQGPPKERASRLLRRTFCRDGKIRDETSATITAPPGPATQAVRAVSAGKTLVMAREGPVRARSLPDGDVAAVWAMARQLGLPALLGPAGRERDLASASVISRAARPASKLTTCAWWAGTTLGVDLDVAGASTDQVYAAMDCWLTAFRAPAILRAPAIAELAADTRPPQLSLFNEAIKITDTTISRNQPGIGAEAGPDGTHVIRTTVPAGDLDTATVVTACKNQAQLERDLQTVSGPPLPSIRSWRQSGTSRP